MGDVKELHLKVAIGDPNTSLRAALEALADEHGDQALASEFALWAIDNQQLSRRKAGRPGVWKSKGSAKGNHLKAVWFAVEVECHKRGKKVKPAMEELFKQLRGRPWVIDLGGDETLTIESWGRARKLYSDAQRLRRGDWDRTLEWVKKIVDGSASSHRNDCPSRNSRTP